MTYNTGTMNTTRRDRIIVPPTAEIMAMTDDQLIALRADLVDAQTMIEAQIAAAKNSGDAHPDWLIRSNGALAHMRRGLTVIKSELMRRTGHYKPTSMPADIQPAFEAIDTIKNVLKHYRHLIDTVTQFLDDDNDDNYQALCDAVGIQP